MPSGEESILISADASIIFDVVHDYQLRLQWDPFLKEARLLGGSTSARLGVRTLCTTKSRLGGWAMETVYVSHRRPRVAAVKMIRGPWMLAAFAASLRNEPLAPRTTRLIYRYNFRIRPRCLAPVLNPFLQTVFSHETRGRLCALKRIIENDKHDR